MLGILALIGLWCALVASLSGVIAQWPSPLQAIFYLIAGIAWIWVLPLRRMLVWMETGKWG